MYILLVQKKWAAMLIRALQTWKLLIYGRLNKNVRLISS